MSHRTRAAALAATLVLTLLAPHSGSAQAAAPVARHPHDQARAADTPRAFSDRLRLAVNRNDRTTARRMASQSAFDKLFALRSSGYRYGVVGTCRPRTFTNGYDCPVPITRQDGPNRQVVFTLRGRPMGGWSVVRVR